MNIDNVIIPDMYNPLRTIVVNLGSILDNQNEVGWNQMLNSEDFFLRVNKTILDKNEGESGNEYLLRISDINLFAATVSGVGFTIDLPIMTLPDFVDNYIAQKFETNELV